MSNNIEDKYAVCVDCEKLLPKSEMIGMWDESEPTDILWVCNECLEKSVKGIRKLNTA